MANVSFQLLGDTRIKGATELSDSYWHISIIGGNNLDLRKATFPQDRPVNIKTFCLVGNTKILVPPGTKVDVSALRLLGDREVDISQAEKDIHNYIKVKHFGVIGDTKVRSEPLELPIEE